MATFLFLAALLPLPILDLFLLFIVLSALSWFLSLHLHCVVFCTPPLLFVLPPPFFSVSFAYNYPCPSSFHLYHYYLRHPITQHLCS
ncbi:MAG: hypothetical protein J3Q66DRAFT_76881 [Benniella sp.]|nr:MAG: hypothetical protein J3Q66DRAFT_76881 [Benniella sp.]